MSDPFAPFPAPGAAPGPAPAKAPAAPEDFDRLLNDLMEDPEEVLRADLSDEALLELQKRLNPYAGIAGPARPDTDFKRIAAASYTNLREDYLRRFTATSLIGFLFQVFEEYEPPPEQRRWTPRSAKKKGAAPCNPAALVEQLESALAVAREAAATATEASTLKQEAALASLEESPAAAGLEARTLATEARAAGLLYAAAHAAHRIGGAAGAGLHATALAGRAYPEVRAVIDQYPLPPPPGQVEVPAAVAKELIGGFLRSWFEFDPSVHVRSGYDAKKLAEATALARFGSAEVPVDTADPGHLTLAALLARAPKPADPEVARTLAALTETPRLRDCALCLLRTPEFADAALTALAEPEAYLQWLAPLDPDSPARAAAVRIPPQDTFHRWNYYTEVNYEALRTITETLYPERSDLDWAIALWAVFEGTAEEVDQAFDQHCQKYQDETPSAIKALEFGAWSLLADFKENRANIRFYNKHTEVIKRILDRHAEDKRIGGDLMRQRVRTNKARNIAEAGPDAPGLNQYRRQVAAVGRDVGSKGAEKVITPSEMKRLERAGGDLKAARELEVLDEAEANVARLEALGASRPLSVEERRELEAAKADAERAREMLDVPEDAIQVDVFTNDPRNKTFGKSHFFTKAEAPEHLDREKAREAAQAAQAGPPGRQLAPYAVKHIEATLLAERTAAAMKAEAEADARTASYSSGPSGSGSH